MTARRMAFIAGLVGALATVARRTRRPAYTISTTPGPTPPTASPDDAVPVVPSSSAIEAESTATPDEPGLALPPGWEAGEVAPPRPAARSARSGPLRGISEIRRFFHANDVPVWLVAPSPFALLGVDRWVRRTTFVSHYDSFDGAHPNVLVPMRPVSAGVESLESINGRLVAHEELVARVRAAGGGKVVILPADAETEQLAVSLGLELAAAPASLRDRLASRIESTRLAEEVGLRSAPHVLGSARSYEGLVSLAEGAGLGRDLVVQTATPSRDRSTTFVVSTREDWDAHAAELTGQHLKVMQRITCGRVSIDGVVTRHGTLVAPRPTEVIELPASPPLARARCTEDAALDDAQRALARGHAHRVGDRMGDEGYRGAFTLDLLHEAVTGSLYLSGLHPGVRGTSSLSNVGAVARGEMPPFLFHLLEFMDVEYELDLDALDAAWARQTAVERSSTLVLTDPADRIELITEAPRSGIWRIAPDAHGGVRYLRDELDWHSVAGSDEAFYLKLAGEGEYRQPGADLGVLVVRGGLADGREPTDRARRWIEGITSQFWTAPAPVAPPARSGQSLSLGPH